MDVINLRATPLSVAIDSQRKAYRIRIFVSNQQLKKLRECMKMAQTSEEKLQKMIASRLRTQERAREKAQQKQADPEWRRQQFEKKQAQSRAYTERQRVKQQSKPRPPARIAPKRDVSVPVKKKSTRGTKGRTPTAEERRVMERLGTLPCIPCYMHGVTTYPISLHHIDGRTAPDAHKRTLPICVPHHQHAAPKEVRAQYPWLVPVHADGNVGGKAEFERLNGKQEELLAVAYELAGIDTQ